MHKLLSSAFLVVLLAACGGGSGGDGLPSPTDRPDQVIVVNRTPGLVIDRVLIEAFELGNIVIPYTTIDTPVLITTGFSHVIDQPTADAFFAGIPGPAGMDTFLFYGPGPLEQALDDLDWNPGDGSYIVQVTPNPNFPVEEEQFIVTELTLAEYLAMLASGEIQEQS